MSRGMPSMTGLLGMLAIAGYQNRDKLADMFRNATSGQPAVGANDSLSGMLGNLGGLVSGGGVSSLLNGGIGELLSTSDRTAKMRRLNPGSSGSILDQSGAEPGNHPACLAQLLFGQQVCKERWNCAADRFRVPAKAAIDRSDRLKIGGLFKLR